MFMCRSLEEFRETYQRLLREPPGEPEVVGPIIKAEPSDRGDDDSDQDSDHQPKRYRLVVKREEC